MGSKTPSAGPAESTTAEARRLARIQGDIAETIFNQSDPFRSKTFGRLTDEVRNMDDPITIESLEQNPAFGAIKGAAESQFGRARENIISGLPAGNVLDDALARHESQHASTLTSGFGALAADELARRERTFGLAASAAVGAPQVAASAAGGGGSILTALAGQQAAVAQAQADRAAGKDQSLGQAAGTAASIAFK